MLTRNLQEVFGENNPARRRAAVDEIWTDDGVFYDDPSVEPHHEMVGIASISLRS